MSTTWNSNTVQAGKWMALTLGAFAFLAASDQMRAEHLLVPFGESVYRGVGFAILTCIAMLALVTTYFSVAAMRCKASEKKDVWAGFLVFLVSGLMFVAMVFALSNDGIVF